MLNFLLANRLQFQPMNNAKQKNKQWTFIYKFSIGYGLTIFKYHLIVKPCSLCVMAIEQSLTFKIYFMTFFHQNIDILIGVFLLLISICTFVYPPKFSNAFYGVTTKWTLKNETIWAAGQKLFAISILIIGFVFLLIGILKLRTDIPSFSMVLLLIGLWILSKYFVHKILERKYPTV